MEIKNKMLRRGMVIGGACSFLYGTYNLVSIEAAGFYRGVNYRYEQNNLETTAETNFRIERSISAIVIGSFFIGLPFVRDERNELPNK